jgi:hypothetical protein
MKARRLLALSILSIAFACEGHQSPTAPGTVKSVPLDSTAVLSDGAHGGNPDFFFLPPLVPFPYRNANFELGKFNNTLKPSLRIEICELSAEPLNALPKTTTACAAAPIKTFAPGTVQLVNLPIRQGGWWSLFQLPPDGFYYVLWDTRQAGLVASKYYRIKVLLAGSTVPIGYADVDPMSNLREWRYALTGDVVQLVNGWLLPIPFRVENGALCGGAISCTSETVGNTNPGGEKVVQLVGNDGVPIAGARFPDNWLPPGFTNVVVTISSVNTGPDNPDRTEGTRCHATLDLQQFRSCFKFTTTPVLPLIGEGPDRYQFMAPVTVAVCYILQDSEDPREKFAEIYASGTNEAPHALKDASDVGILGATGHNCGTNSYGVRSSNPLVQLASAGWSKLKGGLDRAFGVKTAYAVDVGLGGITKRFSNVGPALTAHMQRYSFSGQSVPPGAITTSIVRIVGSQHHASEGATEGIGGLPVTFTVASGNGTLNPTGIEAPPATQLTLTTNATPTFELEGLGFVEVDWTHPASPGVYRMTATTPAAIGGPIVFSDTIRADRMLSMQTGATVQLVPNPGDVVATWSSSDPTRAQVSSSGLVTAIIGGESTSGTGAATVTSVLITGQAGTSALVNSLEFNIFPRVTTLAWVPVQGAATYDVVIEYGNGCVLANCSVWSASVFAATGLTDSTYTFDFVGAQPGRWQVVARDANGAVLSTSPFVYFAYNI